MLDTVSLIATCRLTDAGSASRSLTTSRTCYEQYQRYRRYLQHCSFRTMDTFCFDVTPFQSSGWSQFQRAGRETRRRASYWLVKQVPASHRSVDEFQRTDCIAPK